ncbi:MAG: RNA-splicing ligase RtcB, partial [Clostridia bacterium]|nr:RNA-splicing ligase RtcB [Clostridia bacterium]
LTMEEFKEQMAGIYSTSVTPQTLDESPMAYKKLEDIVDNITPTVKIEKRIIPIYNFKASETFGRRKR